MGWSRLGSRQPSVSTNAESFGKSSLAQTGMSAASGILESGNVRHCRHGGLAHGDVG
jgi:hypothetical protein